MAPDNLDPVDLAGLLVGFSLTLFVISYVFGDNALYRLAVHIFVGAAAGIAVSIAWRQVIQPMLLEPLVKAPFVPGRLISGVIPVGFCLLLLLNFSPRLAVWSKPALAFMVGVGAATAVGGAVLGTIMPQVAAAILTVVRPVSIEPAADLRLTYINGLTMLVSTIAVLVYFQFWHPAGGTKNTDEISWSTALRWVGKFCVAVTLGLVFAGVYLSALAALVDRLAFIYAVIDAIIQP